MFSRKSRYKNSKVVIDKDRHGHHVKTAAIRLLPEVEGNFRHTLEEDERLDHLAYKYYKEPVKWWRICDANPHFLSPPALLGKEPFVTARFTVSYKNEDSKEPPPWYKLIKILSGKIDVKRVFLQEEDPRAPVPGNNKRIVTLVYNRLTIDIDALLSEVEELSGFQAQLLQTVTRVGKQIVIPPHTVE
jgi:hypothetical protein